MRTLIALLTFATLGVAQTCPHQTIDPQRAEVRYGPVVSCSSLELRWQGLRLGGGVSGCPMFAIVTPPRDATKHSPDSWTYTTPAGVVSVTLLSFHCESEMLWFIRLGSDCRHVGQRVIATLATYAQHPCAVEVAQRDLARARGE